MVPLSLHGSCAYRRSLHHFCRTLSTTYWSISFTCLATYLSRCVGIVINDVCDFVCLYVRALKDKRVELSTPKRLRSHGIEYSAGMGISVLIRLIRFSS